MKVFLAPNFQNTIGLPPFPDRRLELWRAAKAETGCKFISFWAQTGLDAKGAETVATTIPVSWSMRYVASGLAQSDPAIIFGLRSVGIQTIDLTNLEHEGMQAFGKAAMDAGIGRYAMVAPIHGPSDFRTVTTFTFDELSSETNAQEHALANAIQRHAYKIAAELVGTRLEHTKSSTRLTDREKSVLRLSAAGETYESIGAALGISKWTVVAHMKTINTKLGTRNKAEAISMALRDKHL